MIFLDSETCGLTGPMVLLQWAEDDGPISLHEIWKSPISETLDLIEYIVTQPVCGFNLVFDWFHLTKIYNILRIFKEGGYTDVPTVNSMIKVDAQAPAIWCLKPPSAMDLMLHARKTEFQSLMGRRPLTLRKIPRVVAYDLIGILDSKLSLPDILFAGKSEGQHWIVQEIEDQPDLVNLKLEFAPSTSLRALAAYCLGAEKTDFPIPKWMSPTEHHWKPYGQVGDKPWGVVIWDHIRMWSTNSQARYYAENDVVLTRNLYKYFKEPKPGDTDSMLACAVGSSRWRGFHLDHSKIDELIDKYTEVKRNIPTAPNSVKALISRNLSDDEKTLFFNTKKETLEMIAGWQDHPAAQAASKVLAARRADKRVNILKKLKSLERFHPDFKIIGTRSNRMAGGSSDSKSDSINPQGIPRGDMRECFTFAGPDEKLVGGDAISFEVVIIDAVYQDVNLHNELKSGKKFHGLMGEIWFEGKTYDQIMSEIDSTGEKLYNRSKNTDFAWVYGAEENKISETAGISVEKAREANERLAQKFPEVAKKRNEMVMRFCSMRQPKGIGTNVEWHDPDEYVENLFGFRRYFTLENQIVKTLYQLGQQNLFPQVKSKIIRHSHRGEQTIQGAVKTALFAAAFGLQAYNMRAAGNHVIQSTGGHITKAIQKSLEDHQPVGIHPWIIRTFQIHDEIWAVNDGTIDTHKIIQDQIEHFRNYVPLLDWEWKEAKTWADK